MFFNLLFIFIVLLLGLGGVAFVTLLERKLLGLSQSRLGPNKSSFFGLLQPVADGVKLLFKDLYFIMSSQSLLFFMSPLLLLLLFFLLWSYILPWLGDMSSLKYSSLMFFSLLGLGTYLVILTGLSSTSAFSKLGGLRGMLQSLSFEVALILLFLVVLVFFKSYSIKEEVNLVLELLSLWLILWFILSLMETNRAPFDLLEGESELISGFNIEMGSLTFVFLFLSEYGMVIVMMMIMSCSFNSSISPWSVFLVSFALLMRSCFPRLRYDVMMSFMWMMLLPVSVLIFALFFLFY